MKCILVVDDSAANLKFVESVLKEQYKLILVKTGEKALAYLAKNPYWETSEQILSAKNTIANGG